MERVSGLRFVVVGAGRSGLALARFLLDRGGEVVLTDSRLEGLDPEVGEMGRRGARLDLGGHDAGSFTAADRVLVSPGVPLTVPAIQSARRAGVPVWGEIEFASRFLKGKMIGITGTNGKSTTTTLTALLLAQGGLDATACGNLGTPLIDLVAGDGPSRHYVVELSSFQLEAIETFRPGIAVLLNVAPDHQDRYERHSEYVNAKGRIFENQRREDRAVLNRDDPETFGFAGRMAAGLSLFSRLQPVRDGACLEEGRVTLRLDGRSRTVLPADAIPLVGVHNLENVLASVAVADLCGVPPGAMAAAIGRFRGLPHRTELVAEIESVRYYNDSKATNVAATARSLESFSKGVILILGGKDKGGDFASLVPLIRERAAGLIFMGKARDSIRGQVGEPVPSRTVPDLAEAVAAAREMAAPGQIVLLAPGCASFDAYRSYEERGEDFRARVLALRQTRKSPGTPGAPGGER
jgi:UDP-N-acetylmuramoylalanine--D-glutamate ligase